MERDNNYLNRIITEDISDIIQTDLPWSKLDGKTILITGANGYLASYIVYSLIKRNDSFNSGTKVVALCRSREKSERKFKTFLNRNDFVLLVQDVVQKINDCYPADFIIHTASNANPKSWNDDPFSVLDTNINGTRNILEKAKEWNSKKVLVYFIKKM